MARRRLNPFYALLGVVGFVFTITAVSACIPVLRGVRPAPAAGGEMHPIERLLDRHGTAILAGELVVMAIATVGAVALDHAEGRRQGASRTETSVRAEAAPPASEP